MKFKEGTKFSFTSSCLMRTSWFFFKKNPPNFQPVNPSTNLGVSAKHSIGYCICTYRLKFLLFGRLCRRRRWASHATEQGYKIPRKERKGTRGGSPRRARAAS